MFLLYEINDLFQCFCYTKEFRTQKWLPSFICHLRKMTFFWWYYDEDSERLFCAFEGRFWAMIFSSVWAGNFEGGGTCLRVRGPIKPLPLKPLWTSLHYVTKGFMVGAYLHPSKRAVLENYSPTYERFCYWTNESSQPMLRKWLPNFVPSFKQWSSLDQWKFILRWTTRWWLVGSF